MARLERVLQMKLRPLINRQYMDAASLITQGVRDVDHVVNLQTTRLRKLLRAHYRRVAMTSGRQAIIAYDPPKSMNESFWNSINQHIALNTGRKIQQIQGNTLNSITKVMQKGIQEGETNREIAKRLRKTGKVASVFNSIRIARTETLGMYNKATDASVDETGLKFNRVWSTTKDLRTRRRKKKSKWDHWIVDGQKRKQNEPFDVSGEKLDFPGDPKGSAGSIINCRCVLLYERDRSLEANPKPLPGLKPVSSLPVISVPANDFPVVTSEVIENSKPMLSIGRFSNCVLDKKSIKASGLDPCIDITRTIDGKDVKWFLRGKQITNEKELLRLKSMRLPPAWSNVVASADPIKKVQAIGMDKAGRWQYRYSENHIAEAAKKKFNRQKLFSKDIKNIRSGYTKGINNNDPRSFLLSLEDQTAIRAGSTTDFKAKKKAYGLTTLQHEHLKINGDKITLDFLAKEGIPAHYELKDKKLAKWLLDRKNKTAVGEMLFPDVPASKLNSYIRELTNGKKYSIKDFRTYHGTRIAYDELKQYGGKSLKKKEKDKIIKKVTEKASKFLANTPVMAKKSYIDPMVWDFIGGL